MEAKLRLLSDKIAIAIVEDDVIAREGLSALLAQKREFAIVASVIDLNALTSSEARPDIILIDSARTAENDAEIPLLTDVAKRAKVIATRVSTGHRHLVDLVRAGVAAFVLKDASFLDLVTTIRAVAKGAQVMPPGLLDMLVDNLAHERERARDRSVPGGSALAQMTAQEREIVMLIASGKNNKEIAAQRRISPHTAKSHVRNIMEKLSVHSRLQIAAHVNRERWSLPTHQPAADAGTWRQPSVGMSGSTGF